MSCSLLKWPDFSTRAFLLGAIALIGASSAFGDSFRASYLAPGVQTPAGITSNYETFSSASSSPFVSHYNGSAYTGTYTGAVWLGADQYGGAGGTGIYPETYTSYTVTINPSVNYFGLWFSALDDHNQLQFYRGSTLVYSFTPTDFVNLVGSCPASAFCGNPNPQFSGQNRGQQYAYLNFYDTNGLFNKIVFSEPGGGGGFESDNHAVAVLTSAPGGTLISGSPEPGTLGALLLGCALILAGRFRRISLS